MRNRGFSWKTLSLGKRVVLLVGCLLIVVIALAFFFIPFKKGLKKTVSLSTPKTKEEIIQDLNRDSDGDGLPDWEEAIYGTDPHNPDTDGDGTPDGEEIKEGRNPLVPGHKLSDGTWSDKLSVPLPPPEDGNKTQELANSLIGTSLTEMIAKNIAGGPVGTSQTDPSAISALTDPLTNAHLLDKVIPPETRDLTTTDDNSPEMIKRYFNSITQIYISNFSDMESDVSVLYLATNTGDARAFRKLDANITAIQNAIEQIKHTPVPTQWVSFAKNDILYLSKTLAAVKILRNTENDPVSSLLILQSRMQLIDDMANLYQSTKTQLDKKGITFSETEPAYGFFLKLK